MSWNDIEAAEILKRQAILSAAGVPDQFLPKCFSNWVVGNDEQFQSWDTALRYANDFGHVRRRGACLVFAGTNGTGKTHLAVAVLNDVLNQKFTAFFKDASFFVWAEPVEEGEPELAEVKTIKTEDLNALVAPDLLVLDDVGGDDSAEAAQAIREIIYRRYDGKKPILITTNKSLSELTEFLGERVIDRLREGGGKVAEFDWVMKGPAK